jgi:hypothetical protein
MTADLLMLPSVRGLSLLHLGVMSETSIFNLLSVIAERIAYMHGRDSRES